MLNKPLTERVFFIIMFYFSAFVLLLFLGLFLTMKADLSDITRLERKGLFNTIRINENLCKANKIIIVIIVLMIHLLGY